MTTPYRQFYSVGQTWTPTAEQLNHWTHGANIATGAPPVGNLPTGTAFRLPPYFRVRIKNESGEAVPTNGVLALDEPIIKPEHSEVEFRGERKWRARKPRGDDAEDFVITETAIPDGEFGWACATGAIYCKVRCKYDDEWFATSKADDVSKLFGSVVGSNRILWRPPLTTDGTEETLDAWVSLKSHPCEYVRFENQEGDEIPAYSFVRLYDSVIGTDGLLSFDANQWDAVDGLAGVVGKHAIPDGEKGVAYVGGCVAIKLEDSLPGSWKYALHELGPKANQWTASLDCGGFLPIKTINTTDKIVLCVKQRAHVRYGICSSDVAKDAVGTFAIYENDVNGDPNTSASINIAAKNMGATIPAMVRCTLTEVNHQIRPFPHEIEP